MFKQIDKNDLNFARFLLQRGLNRNHIKAGVKRIQQRLEAEPDDAARTMYPLLNGALLSED